VFTPWLSHHILVGINNHIIGAITAAAFTAEKYFDRIQVFERRESAGGTWYFEPFSGTTSPD
jgi:cation diffusion facilitator CzcD-associated flavoprotein CzcO